VAASSGLRTAVVNWWATWPAPSDAGVVLTDRATLRLERGGELDDELAPATLYRTLLPAWPAIRDEVRRTVVQSFGTLPSNEAAAMGRAAEQDALQTALAARVFLADAELCAVYLPGLDIAQYSLLGSAGGSGLPTSALAARLELLQRYYEYLDALIAPLVDAPSPGRTLALLADPGRAAARGPGLLALTGFPARSGMRLDGSRADVAPTLLYLLGVPISRELPGAVRRALLDESFVRSNPVRHVEGYGRRIIGPRPPAASPLDRDMLDRLRSLGYIR